MYDITLDKPHSLFEVRLRGLLSIDEVRAYVNELRRLFITNRIETYAMVIDIAGCPIQPQDTIRALGEHMASMPKARALAIVTGSSLARMQVRRLFKQPYARITATLEEGRAWVLSGVEPAAA